MAFTDQQLLAAIDADTAPGGLAALAAIGADNQIAERLAAETVPAVRNPTYVKEGMLRQAIIACEIKAGTAFPLALSDADVAIAAIKAKLTTGEGSSATAVFWAYADVNTPVEGLNVGGDLERSFLDSLVPTTISEGYANAIKALAETTAPKWPGITADVVSDALKERRPNGKVVS